MRLFSALLCCVFFPALRPFLHSASKFHQILFIMGYNDLLFSLFPWSSPAQPSPNNAKADSSLLGGTFALSKSSTSQFVQVTREVKVVLQSPLLRKLQGNASGRNCCQRINQVTSEDCWRWVYTYQIFSPDLRGQHTANTQIFQRNRQGTKLEKKNAPQNWFCFS